MDATFEQATLKLLGISEEVSPVHRSLVKSLLRYPGGKSRAVNQILEYLPKGLDTLCSPFIGGASIELACASKLGIKVYGYDAFRPLVHFWQQVLKNPAEIAEGVKKYYPLSRTKFYALQKQCSHLKDKKSLAIAFFVLNRSSFSGTTLSGGMSLGHPRFTPKSIERLARFKIDGFSVKHGEFARTIPKHENDFLYLAHLMPTAGAYMEPAGTITRIRSRIPCFPVEATERMAALLQRFRNYS